ncbi:MAG: HAD family hydrolase [Candidatus Eisenbacteria bacterium]
MDGQGRVDRAAGRGRTSLSPRGGRPQAHRRGELTRPLLLSFDIFGTVIDWRRGLTEACAAVGVPGREAEAAFDAMIDAQGRLEQAAPDRRYRDIVAAGASEVLGLDAVRADTVAATVGAWPAYPDCAPALHRLARFAPLVALTNSDRDHGASVRAALGADVTWTHWLCAEDTGMYKPDPGMWDACATATGMPGGRGWWHVSAYADYDLEEAVSRGLSTVYVERPHRRPGPALWTVPDLTALARVVESLARG